MRTRFLPVGPSLVSLAPIALIAVVGCSANGPAPLAVASQAVPAPSVPAPMVSAMSSANAAPSASAAKAETPPRKPVVPPEKLPDFDPAIVKQLDAMGREKLEIAASICPAAVRHDKKKLLVGCRTCPPFDFESGPDGKVIVDPSQEKGEYFYPIEAVYNGSFLSSGATEAAAVFTGCESHAANYGGTMLVVKRGSVWVAETYRGGFHPDQCKTFTRPDARMILICQWETDHQGFDLELVDSYDFTLGNDDDPEPGRTGLVSVSTDVFGACVGGTPDGLVHVGTISDFNFDTATPDRSPRLLVNAMIGGGPHSKTFDARCAQVIKEIEKPHPREIDLKSTVPATKRTFTFNWTKKGFVPDDQTKKAITALNPPDE